MADHQLPAYLQNRAVPDFTDYASDGLGTVLPPHVSIQGNNFTLIDATGQEYQPTPIMDAVIIDRSNFACKMYYDKPWVPGSDEPPVCWSTNGVGPSKDATVPQSRTCGECQFNVRGSAISKISGASIKACRDEYHMAILLPSIPGMIFRYVLTPGSFENWQNYVGKFKNSNVKISMVVTRMGFQPKVNGVVTFESTAYVDEATNGFIQKALIEKATDALVGRLDTPRVAAIAAPATVQVTVDPNTTFITPQPQQPYTTQLQIAQQPSQQVQQPPFTPAPAAPQIATAGPVAAPQTTAPADGQPRRRRRTAAEMQAAQPGAANGQASQQPAAAPQAPFPHPGAAAPQQPSLGSFGMSPGQPAAANPELSTMLDDFFKS